MAEQGDDGMKDDVTLTTFGLVIAYLLPGLAGLYGLSFWSASVSNMFHTFLTSQSNVGLFLIVLLGSLVLGLFANGLRWLVFEVWFYRSHRFKPHLMKNLSGERRLGSYRSAIDEIYRYHQWWGGTAIMAPIGYLGWAFFPSSAESGLKRSLIIAGFSAVEVLCLYVAGCFWIKTVDRLHYVLQEEAVMNEVAAKGGTPGGPASTLPRPDPK